MFELREGTGAAGGSGRRIIVLAFAVICLGILALPGGASASSVECRGKVVRDSDNPEPNSFKYQFRCDEVVKAYSVVSNRQVDFFGTEVVGFLGAEPTSDAFSCEGSVPGNGIGCYGTLNPPNRVVGEIGFPKNPCLPHPRNGKFRLWATVTTVQLKFDGTPYTISSEPFALAGPGCKAKQGRQKKSNR